MAMVRLLATMVTILCTLLEAESTGTPSMKTASNEELHGIQEGLKRDCMKLMETVILLGKEERIEKYQRHMKACANFLVASEHGPPAAEDMEQKNGESKDASISGDKTDQPQRRAYDYIRFGKRLMAEEAAKRLPGGRGSSKNLGTHEYIRFG